MVNLTEGRWLKTFKLHSSIIQYIILVYQVDWGEHVFNTVVVLYI